MASREYRHIMLRIFNSLKIFLVLFFTITFGVKASAQANIFSNSTMNSTWDAPSGFGQWSWTAISWVRTNGSCDINDSTFVFYTTGSTSGVPDSGTPRRTWETTPFNSGSFVSCANQFGLDETFAQTVNIPTADAGTYQVTFDSGNFGNPESPDSPGYWKISVNGVLAAQSNTLNLGASSLGETVSIPLGAGSNTISFSVGSTGAYNSYMSIDNVSLTLLSTDITPPTLVSSTPVDNTTGVAVTDNIVLTFSENVQAGSGNIVISDGASDTRTIAIGDAQVSISGATVTINPTADLNSSTSYYVQVASTAIEDTSGNAYAGISNTTTLNFTTADVIAPTLTSSTPSDDATGVAVTDNIVLTFSENVQAGSGNIVISDGSSDTRTIAIGDAQVSISGATVTINPTADLNSSTSYYVQVASTAIEDTSGNAYAGISNTTTLNFTTATISTPATEFAGNEATIRRQIQTVALQSIRNSVQEATDFMILARERFRVCRVNGSGAKSSICGTNIPFDIDGSTSISTSSANIGGSFFGQFGNFDGTYRRMTSGDFNIQRDADGNTTGALSGRIAWEYLSDNSMLGWFVGAEYAQSDFAGTFTGEQNSFGASIGGYFVSEVQDQLFLDGHLTFRQNEHELQLSNGTLDLDSVYHSSTILTGLTLTGVSAINDDAEVSPTLSFNAARTDLGTIGFTGMAYGLTDSTLSMDGGAVSYADISFAPKYRVAMDGQSLPSSLLVATVAPRAMCEYVELTGSTTRSCGSGLSLGLLGTAANGNGSLEFEMALDKVGGQLRHSIGLSASLQY
jgi:methionine-rich copper-binding protein CopC